jgi:O-succinylbenzoic acid--CoA ligase
MFFDRVLEHPPSSISVITGKKIYTYSDLIREINFSHLNIKKIGIGPGDHAGIITNNDFYFIPLLFALWNCGAVPVLLNAKLQKDEIQNQIIFARCKFLFIHEKFLEKFSVRGIISAEFPFREKNQPEENPYRNENKPGDTAVIIFTSGSSGRPKAVMLGFENLFQSAVIGNKVLNLNTNDRFLASLPFHHIGGFSIITRSVISGSSVIIPDSLSADDLIRSIHLSNPTAISLVSNQLKKFVDAKIISPDDLRIVLLGGGFFDKDLILSALKLGWKIAKVYGSTETSSFVSFMDCEEAELRPGASGKAISPNEIIITEEGEIAVRSPSVMKGYYQNKDDTSLRLREGVYFSGDIGYLDKEGYLFVEAKRDDLIVSGGENINPFEIEKAILTNGKIDEAVVVGTEDEEWGQAVSAAVVLKDKEKLSGQELKNFLKDKITPFMIPKKILFLTELPKTELGKIKRDKVRKLFYEKRQE